MSDRGEAAGTSLDARPAPGGAEGRVLESVRRIEEPGVSAAETALDDADEAVRSERLFREVNEQIVMLDSESGVLELVCECGDDCCFDRLAVARLDYERVRSFPSRFVVKPGHGGRDGERIVVECSEFVVVEKTGAGAAAAIGSDPRRRLRSTERRRSSP
jgi:hypothetical protein